MSKEKQAFTLNNKEVYKKLLTVALPIAVQSLVGTSLTLVDNLMVGSLGESELNAVGISVQVYFIHWMVMFGFTSGVSTFIAQLFGTKDFANIKKATGFAMTITVSISLLFFVAAMIFSHEILRIFTRFPEIIDMGVGYVRMGAATFLFVAITVPLTAALRATQQTHIPLFISVFAFLTNTILNYIFIFGNFGAPKMGIVGAALATLIARFLEMSLMIYVVFVRKNIVGGKIKEFFSYKKDFAMGIVKNAIPTTINETLWGIGTALYVAAFARVGITEGAAIQACNTINNLFIMAAFSLGDATLILVGQKLGEGKLDYAFALAKKFVKCSLVIGIVFGIGLIICGKPILSLFDFTPRGADLAFSVLIVYGSTMWMALYNATNITGVLRCGGDTVFAMLTETLAVWCIGIPLAFITALGLHWPIYFAVLAVKMEDVVKGIILTRRFFSKKWAKNVIKHLS
ncbi:MAG: MATE family efflux transporter [Anaerovoracaceae bacterium]